MKSAIKYDCKRFEESKTKEIIEASRSTKKWKREFFYGKQLAVGLKEKYGENISNRSDMLMEATKFYKELYGAQMKEETLVTTQEGEDGTELTGDTFLEILNHEVEVVLTKLKGGKAPGLDKIENKILKDFAAVLAEPLTMLFNWIIAEETIVKQWKKSEIILLYKKGDKKLLNNYRLISLSSNIGKIFIKIMKNRAYPQLDSTQPGRASRLQKGLCDARSYTHTKSDN